MQCPDCAVAIPASQNICPRCYQSLGVVSTASPLTRKAHLILAMTERRGAWWQQRFLLVTERVEEIIVATTPAEFAAYTSSGRMYDLCFVEAAVFAKLRDRITELLAKQRSCLIAIEYRRGDVPATPPLAGAIMVELPGDIDPSLVLMHQLLNALGAPGPTGKP